MKKFIAIFAIIATFGFVACSSAPETDATEGDSTIMETPVVEEPTTPAVDSIATQDTTVAPAKTN